MPGTLETIAEWMAHQRWYAGKDHAPVLRLLEDRVLDSDGGARVVDLLLMDEGGSVPVLYQVPVIESRTAEAHAIGVTDAGIHLADAPHDPRFTHAILAEMAPELAPRLTGSTVLSGEQSNTSLVIALDDEPAVIAKVFRTLHHGDNPDVTLQSALSAAGSRSVPAFVGRVSAEWGDVGRAGGRARGDLVFAQEFVAGSHDGWGLALAAASRGEGFAEEARALGIVTADVHETLARVLPTAEPGDAEVEAIAGTWEERLALAAAAVPSLAEVGDRIRAVYALARAVSWPALQRVHGDLHLGQSLHSEGRGWVLVDFEGEPLRPMDQRDRPDSAVRDVAGMLRSFDYAEGASTGAPEGWAAEARAAFLEGYGERATSSAASGALLDAFELDKAVYEALYEARNRPTWLAIPLRGIHAVLDRVVPVG